MRRIVSLFAAAAAALILTGCGSLFNLQLFITGEQTSLEKQVLGSYSALGEDLMLYGSVRGVDEEGSLVPPPATTDSMRAAFNAMRNREYNRDDVERLLVTGHAGEGNEGLLVPLEGGAPLTGLDPGFVMRIIEEENRDREAIITRLQETIGQTQDAERGEIARIFADLNQDAAPAGASVQERDGKWTRK
ncbi:MAG: hypothetical protein PWP23_1741 [Candidatus Sumerlaeota bacterium]|nr:hypothetical protein [Candidatus Sumerlaeota bacterium]